MTKKLSELEIESIEKEAKEKFKVKIVNDPTFRFDWFYTDLFAKLKHLETDCYPALDFIGVESYDRLVTKIEPYFEGNSPEASQAAKQALLNYRYYNDLTITALDYFGTHYLSGRKFSEEGDVIPIVFSISLYQQFLSSIKLGLYTNLDYIVLGRYGLNYADSRDPSPRLEALKDYLRQIYLWREAVNYFQRRIHLSGDRTAHYSPEVWADYQKVSKEHFINAFGSDKGQELFNKWVGSVKPADQGSFEKVQEQVFNVIAEELLKKQGVDLKPKSEEKKPSGMNRDYAKEVEENKKKDEEKKKREEERKKREETPPPPPKPKTPPRSPSPQPEPKPKPDDKEPEDKPQPEPKPEQEPPKKEDKGKEKEKREQSPSRGESQKPLEDKTIPKETSFSTNLNDIINKLNANLNEDTQKNNPEPFTPSPGLGQPLTAMEKEEVKKLPWRVVNFCTSSPKYPWELKSSNWFGGKGSVVSLNLELLGVVISNVDFNVGQFKASFDNPDQKGYDLLKVDEEWRNKIIKEKFPNSPERERERDKILFNLSYGGIFQPLHLKWRDYEIAKIRFKTQAQQTSTRIWHWHKNVEDAYDLTTNDNLLGLLWNKGLRGSFSWFGKKAKWGTAPKRGCLIISNSEGFLDEIGDSNSGYTYYFIFYDYFRIFEGSESFLTFMDRKRPRSVSQIIQFLNSKGVTTTICIGPDLLNLKEVLTPEQKTKVKTVPREKKDQAEKQVTDPELKAMNLTREDFNKLNTPFLDKATFWNILKKAVQADNPQAMEKLLNNLYDHLPVTSLTAMFNEMVDNNPVFNQEEKKKLKDLWEKAQSKEAKKKVWETLTSHQAQREAHNKKTQAEKDKIFEEQVNNNPAYGPPKADTQERRDKFKEYETADETKKAKMQEEENKKFTQGQNAFQWGDFFQAASTFHAGGGDDSINCEGDDVNTSFSWKDSIAAIHRLKDIVLLKPANMDAGMKANRPAWEVVMNNPLTYIFLFIGVVMAVLSKVFTK